MDERTERARSYRERARELRAIARDLADQEQRKLLLDIADDYENMAAASSQRPA